MSTRKHFPKYSQAMNIVAKFGSVSALADAIGYERTAIHKWMVPKAQKGTDGMVPSSAQERVRVAARLRGILLTADDWAVKVYVPLTLEQEMSRRRPRTYGKKPRGPNDLRPDYSKC